MVFIIFKEETTVAAPTKQGLSYFAHDIGLLKDRKFRSLKLKYGNVVIVIYLALLEMIYGDKGYYIEYENIKDDVIWEVLGYLQGMYQPTFHTVCNVIDEMVAQGLFSSVHYPEIITSKRIQETYYKATVERKTFNINARYWLLNIDEMKALSSKSLIFKFFINQPNNEDNRTINSENQPINEESKKEKNKSNKIIEKKEPDGSSPESYLIKQIIDYLNLKCDTAYKASSELNKQYIIARINEGYKYADFKTVIDKKSNDWKGTEFEKFLRPETLFGNKFESYLNAKNCEINSYANQKGIADKSFGTAREYSKAEFENISSDTDDIDKFLSSL